QFAGSDRWRSAGRSTSSMNVDCSAVDPPSASSSAMKISVARIHKPLPQPSDEGVLFPLSPGKGGEGDRTVRSPVVFFPFPLGEGEQGVRVCAPLPAQLLLKAKR